MFIQVSWKDFSINVIKVDEAIKTLCPSYTGCMSSQDRLLFGFSEEPSDEVKAQILAYWDSIDAASIEAVTYKSADQLKQEADAAKLANINSAKAKLAALGLSEAEISAIIGV
jgi:hypothetical protein